MLHGLYFQSTALLVSQIAQFNMSAVATRRACTQQFRQINLK